MTFEEWVDNFTQRGVEHIFPSKEKLIEFVKTGGKIHAYFGIDPTGPTLHLGHMIPLRKLGQLQEMGHKVTLLIGDFTAMIGDPTGKSDARKQLTREQVLENAKLYKKQASTFLDFKRQDNPATIKFNSKWLGKLKFDDIIKLSSEFTVAQMIERDMFQKRIKDKSPIFLHEFLYPLMQGYDSVAMDVNMEIGGNDQTFNMLCGRDLLSRRGKEKFVLSTQLLVDPTGNKMGKTTGNMVSLTDTPKDMFGKIMSWPDTMIFMGLRLLTGVDSIQIDEMERSFLNGKAHPMELKKKLAFEVVSLYCGKAKAKKAEQEFSHVFQKKEDPTEVAVFTVNESPKNIIDLLVLTKLAESRGEAKRFIEQKGVKVNHEIVQDEKGMVDCTQEILIQRGKRYFAKVVMK